LSPPKTHLYNFKRKNFIAVESYVKDFKAVEVLLLESRVQMVVDGMTGVGKTTLVDILAKELDLVPFNEVFEDSNRLLHKFFYDRERWCFPMQVNFLNHRFKQFKAASLLNSAIMDRSIYSDHIFACMYREIGYMAPEEYNVYQSLLYNMLEHLTPPKLVIYLRVGAREAIRRIKKRGRPDELTVEDSYWKKLHGFYEKHYSDYRLTNLLLLEVDGYDFVKFKNHRKIIVDEVLKKWKELA
jgi:deoxyadenosine/deoxycytidine kinase